MDPDLGSLVRERLGVGELVLGWSWQRKGEVSVRLIQKSLHRTCESMNRDDRSATTAEKSRDKGRQPGPGKVRARSSEILRAV